MLDNLDSTAILSQEGTRFRSVARLIRGREIETSDLRRQTEQCGYSDTGEGPWMLEAEKSSSGVNETPGSFFSCAKLLFAPVIRGSPRRRKRIYSCPRRVK